MKAKAMLMGLVVMGVCAAVRGQEVSDMREFEVTAAAAPRPALLYQLMYEDLADRRPGNAAILYYDAVLLMGPKTREDADKALEAYKAKDDATFGSLVDGFRESSVFTELELAGQREDCDWQPPYREKGAETLLPHLEPMVRGLARMVQLRALREVEQGKTKEAVKTLRLGYELSNKTGREPMLISGLVSVAIQHVMNEVVMEAMKRPESPNLYWALSGLPGKHGVLRRSFEGERQGWTMAMPSMMRVRAGEAISGEQWREVFAYIERVGKLADPNGRPIEPVEGVSAELLAKARQTYAAKWHVSAEQAAKMDAAAVLGDFYYDQFVEKLDEMYKLRGLAYPQWLPMSKVYEQQMIQWKGEQPNNPFVQALPAVHKAILRFAQVDREVAAMMVVEALRGYAAGHGGKLPGKLEELEEMPAPRNPMTGEAFEYSVKDGEATIADSASESPLVYTVKIRK